MFLLGYLCRSKFMATANALFFVNIKPLHHQRSQNVNYDPDM